MSGPTTSPYELRSEPIGEAYFDLLDAASTNCERALLVVRDHHVRSRGMKSALKTLAPHLAYEGRSSYWPGTQVRNDNVATVLHYSVSPEFLDVLKQLAPGLYCWDSEGDLLNAAPSIGDLTS